MRPDEHRMIEPLTDESHLREICVVPNEAWRGHFLEVRRDQVRMPDGKLTYREYIVHPGAVVVVALRDDGRVIVERQWRYPIGRSMIEFPAGKIDPGEPPWRCGIRELFEETGYTAREWARAGVMHNAIAYSTEGIEIWFARGLTAGAAQLDAGEFLDVFDASLEDLEAAAASGVLTDAKSLTSMYWWRQWRDGRWPLQWQSVDDAPAPVAKPAP